MYVPPSVEPMVVIVGINLVAMAPAMEHGPCYQMESVDFPIPLNLPLPIIPQIQAVASSSLLTLATSAAILHPRVVDQGWVLNTTDNSQLVRW